ncbi:DMT family transporter [Ideonella livida]|uniref:DMT family transporter n=1 Tax=Ideonella livida TaxID=2707176 RepID=A0A7C9TGK3_9BURK|nr:DMT family transporter [Ideonella livida]NDY89781.1 DMT family transporter [Ideonella livida]
MTSSSAAGALPPQVVRLMPAVFVLIWSTGFIVARYGMPHAPPFTFLCLRYLFSVLAFCLWVAWARPAWPSDRRQLLHLAVTGVLMHAGYLGGVWAAVKDGMGAGTSALIVGLQPILTGLWLSWSGGHHVARRQWVGLALGFGGLFMVVAHKLGGGEVHAANLAMAVTALLSITGGTLYQKRFVRPCDVRTAGIVQLTAAGLVSLPLALLEPEAVDWAPEMMGALAWSVGALTLGASSLLYLLIQRGAATQVASLMYLVPPCTVALAWWLFGETPGGWALPGVLLIACGVALVVRGAAAPAPAAK